jgi:hypothetical protein
MKIDRNKNRTSDWWIETFEDTAGTILYSSATCFRLSNGSTNNLSSTVCSNHQQQKRHRRLLQVSLFPFEIFSMVGISNAIPHLVTYRCRLLYGSRLWSFVMIIVVTEKPKDIAPFFRRHSVSIIASFGRTRSTYVKRFILAPQNRQTLQWHGRNLLFLAVVVLLFSNLLSSRSLRDLRIFL